MIITECPSCDDNISFTRQPQLRQHMTCPSCRARLQVVLLSPDIELDLIDEQWDKSRLKSRIERSHSQRKRQAHQHYEGEDEDLDAELVKRPKHKRTKNQRKTRK